MRLCGKTVSAGRIRDAHDHGVYNAPIEDHMAQPRIFVSSTYYDLKHLRSSLENFIESLGYLPVLSEKGHIPYAPDRALDESCYREVRNADIFVLIIGGRYGSERSDAKPEMPRGFFERYDSITLQEYRSAVDADIPVYILIDKMVYADYETFQRNKSNESISYAHVDSANVFHLIDSIISQHRNNPAHQFDRYSDIESWLRLQWAGLFRELLSRMSNQIQLLELAAQVSELSAVNQTLKAYLEQVVTTIAPDQSQRLIRDQESKLEVARTRAQLAQNKFVILLTVRFRLDLDEVESLLRRARSFAELIKETYHAFDEAMMRDQFLLDYSNYLQQMFADANQARALLGLPHFEDEPPANLGDSSGA